MKTLLVLTQDFESPQSVMEYAIKLARDFHFNVQVMYIENPNNYPMGTPTLSAAAVAQIQQSAKHRAEAARVKLNDQLAKLMPTISGEVIVEVKTELGNELRIIDDLVEAGEVHMVMVEGHGINSLSLRDSVARHLVRHLNCPLWVIPESFTYEVPEKIVYACDYHEEDIPTMKRLLQLTKPVSPQVTALHVTKNGDFEQRIKKAGFQKMIESKTEYDKIELKAFIEKSDDDMAEIIHAYVNRTNAGLVVILKDNQSFLERIFRADASEEIIQKATKPVLVYHPQTEK